MTNSPPDNMEGTVSTPATLGTYPPVAFRLSSAERIFLMFNPSLALEISTFGPNTSVSFLNPKLAPNDKREFFKISENPLPLSLASFSFSICLVNRPNAFCLEACSLWNAGLFLRPNIVRAAL